MNRALMFLLVAIVLVVIDFYAYQGLKVAISSFSSPIQKGIKTIFWGLTVVTILGFALFEPLSQNQSTRPALMIIMTVGVANMLGKLLFVIWLLIDDIIRFVKWLKIKTSPPTKQGPADTDISRIEFLAQAGAITAALPLIGMGWGVLSGAHDYRVLKRDLKISGLPKAFDGFTIVQISDIHAGSFWSKKAVARGVDMINELAGDAVFFTGDLVNNKANELDGWTDLFGSIQAKYGVFSVLGNHDYGDYVNWSTIEEKKENLEKLIATQRSMGWDLLLDESRTIRKDDQEIEIVGIQNWGAKARFPKYGDLDKALKGTQENNVKLLLSHDPSHWREEVLARFPQIDVMFSGHTHGFQFGIEVGTAKWSPVKYFYPEWADLYSEGAQQLYVNRGFGYIGYPGRLGILPEITLHTLRSADL